MSASQMITESGVMRKSDRWIPWYFVAFFIGLTILNAFFLYIATSTHTGVVTENSYEKGLNYNDTIAAYESQQALDFDGAIVFHDEGVLRFALHDAKASALDISMVTAYVSRPTQAGYDFSVVLPRVESVTKADAGMYETKIDFPLKGQWDVRITAEWHGQHFQKHKRILVK